MSLNQMMDDFMGVYQVEHTAFDGKNSRDMLSLIADEMVELEQELYNGSYNPLGDSVINKGDVVKETIDVLYVAAQRLRRMGVDVDAALAEVHSSNMSKSVPIDKLVEETELARERYPHVVGVQTSDTTGVLRDTDTGKVVKPTTYTAAVIEEGVHYGTSS